MKSMKIDKSEKKEYEKKMAIDNEPPEYPYGLSLHLHNDVLEKLEMGELPEVGQEMLLTAKVKVTHVSASSSEHGKDKSVGLQITDMGIGESKKQKSAVEALYGE